MIYLLTLLVAWFIGLPCLLAALQILSARHRSIADRTVRESTMTPDEKAACLASLDAAQKAERKPLIWDCTAPVVMLLVLPFIKRDADKLPRLFRKWDNNVSMNGDGGGVQNPETGEWTDDRAVKDWQAVQGWLHVNHADPRYGGDCYYAKGHHPRSFWARYVWLGWRNRATIASMDAGVECAEQSQKVADGDGWTVSRAGDLWEVRSHIGHSRCYYGWKLYGAPGRVRPVAIGWAFKKHKD